MRILLLSALASLLQPLLPLSVIMTFVKITSTSGIISGFSVAGSVSILERVLFTLTTHLSKKQACLWPSFRAKDVGLG